MATFNVPEPKLISDKEIEVLANEIICCINKVGLTGNVNLPGLGSIIKTQVRTLEKGFLTNFKPIAAAVGVIQEVKDADNPPVKFVSEITDVSSNISDALSNPIEFIAEELQSPVLENLPLPGLTSQAIIDILNGNTSLIEIFRNSIDSIQDLFNQINMGVTNENLVLNSDYIMLTQPLRNLNPLELSQVLTLLIPKEMKLIPADQINFIDNPPKICLPPIVKILEFILLPIKLPFELIKGILEEVIDIIKKLPKIAGWISELISDPIGFLKTRISEILQIPFETLICTLSPIPISNDAFSQLQTTIKELLTGIVEGNLSVDMVRTKIQELVQQVPALAPAVALLEAIFTFAHCLIKKLFEIIFCNESRIINSFLLALNFKQQDNNTESSNPSENEDPKGQSQQEAQNIKPDPIFDLYRSIDHLESDVENKKDYVLETSPISDFDFKSIESVIKPGDKINIKEINSNKTETHWVKKLRKIKRTISEYKWIYVSDFDEDIGNEDPIEIVQLVLEYPLATNDDGNTNINIDNIIQRNNNGNVTNNVKILKQ